MADGLTGDPGLAAALRETARELLGAKVDLAALRAAPPVAEGDDLWAQLVALGWAGLEIPEALGGAGLGFRELCIVLHEMGRVLLPGPYFATGVLGVGALAGAGAAQRERWLPAIAAGTAVVTAAVAGPAGVPGRLGMVATADGPDVWRLDGTAGFVPHAETADAVAVAALDEDRRPSLFLVNAAADGVAVVAQPTLDPSRGLGGLQLTSVAVRAADAIGAPGEAGAALARVTDRAAIAVAADCLGGAERALELTVQYLKDRHQFGRPIGAFQALKHRAADMLMQVENARVTVDHAAGVEPGDPQRPAAASIAKAVAGGAFSHVAAEMVSLHGGIGFTWEHEAHLYLKRAALDAQLYGDTWWHRDRLARLALGAVR